MKTAAQPAQLLLTPPLPQRDEMYRALVTRDATYDGAFFAAIKTTGIFCRPGCGARKPRPDNVEFFQTASHALHAGYRPCLRCRPLNHTLETPAWVDRLLKLADKTDQRLRAADLRAASIDPVRAARYFRRHFGMTFQAYHRARRVGQAMKHVRGGSEVTAEAISSGFDSESGFRSAFTKLFGAAPTKLDQSNAQILHARWLSTPLGPMLAVASDRELCLLEFIDRRAIESQLQTLRRRFSAALIIPGNNDLLDRLATQLDEYFAATRKTFDVPLASPGTPFQQSVWTALRSIPAGQTRSYADIAREIRRPTAVRAVARSNGDNRIAILIPCHRVIGSDGSPTGYAGGIWRKEWLLNHERAIGAR